MEPKLNSNYPFSNVVGKFCEISTCPWNEKQETYSKCNFFFKVLMKNVVQYSLFVFMSVI